MNNDVFYIEYYSNNDIILIFLYESKKCRNINMNHNIFK